MIGDSAGERMGTVPITTEEISRWTTESEHSRATRAKMTEAGIEADVASFMVRQLALGAGVAREMQEMYFFELEEATETWGAGAVTQETWALFSEPTPAALDAARRHIRRQRWSIEDTGFAAEKLTNDLENLARRMASVSDATVVDGASQRWKEDRVSEIQAECDGLMMMARVAGFVVMGTGSQLGHSELSMEEAHDVSGELDDWIMRLAEQSEDEAKDEADVSCAEHIQDAVVAFTLAESGDPMNQAVHTLRLWGEVWNNLPSRRAGRPRLKL